jgi:hypothetical protein
VPRSLMAIGYHMRPRGANKKPPPIQTGANRRLSLPPCAMLSQSRGMDPRGVGLRDGEAEQRQQRPRKYRYGAAFPILTGSEANKQINSPHHAGA